MPELKLTTMCHPTHPTYSLLPSALTEAAHVAQVAKVVGAHQRQQHIVVLLALVLVHRGDLRGQGREGRGTSIR